ncbi:MAG TPA: hypothetical protein VF502_11880, partial [Stellaceae bacterium]
ALARRARGRRDPGRQCAAPRVPALCRAKAFGKHLDEPALHDIIRDIAAQRYADVHLASVITACAGGNLDRQEMAGLTRAMIAAGDRLDWGRVPIVDKHSIGGLPGNRTSPIVVAIVAACGLVIPKTSSPAFLYRWYFGAHSLKRLQRNILKFCGIGPIRQSLVDMVEADGDAKRRKWLETMRALGCGAL